MFNNFSNLFISRVAIVFTSCSLCVGVTGYLAHKKMIDIWSFIGWKDPKPNPPLIFKDPVTLYVKSKQYDPEQLDPSSDLINTDKTSNYHCKINDSQRIFDCVIEQIDLPASVEDKALTLNKIKQFGKTSKSISRDLLKEGGIFFKLVVEKSFVDSVLWSKSQWIDLVPIGEAGRKFVSVKPLFIEEDQKVLGASSYYVGSASYFKTGKGDAAPITPSSEQVTLDDQNQFKCSFQVEREIQYPCELYKYQGEYGKEVTSSTTIDEIEYAGINNKATAVELGKHYLVKFTTMKFADIQTTDKLYVDVLAQDTWFRQPKTLITFSNLKRALVDNFNNKNRVFFLT